MPLTRNVRAIRSILAFSTMFGFGGGCVAIYSLEDFEKKPPVSCKAAQDCPGTDLCSLRVCDKGVCTRTDPVPADRYLDVNVAQDCKRIKCDGLGGDVVENDPTDLPFDSNDCTDDVCLDGVPSNPARTNQPCGTTTPPLTCSDTGFCRGCQSPSDCGFSNNPCTAFACENEICSRTPRNVGLIVDNAVVGDCIAIFCTPEGGAKEGFAASDAIQDANPCTIETCQEDGKVITTTAPDGTKCGDCQICINGACGNCDATTSDCYNQECVAKPLTCTQASDCPSTYCIDGYCCDKECGSTCMACSEAKTGVPSGLCALVVNGTDPDSDCKKPDADVCIDGACGCENGIADGNETGVDCGGVCGACTGSWNCGGIVACDGVDSTDVCCPFWCGFCVNQTADCKKLEGQTCAKGAADKTLSLGVVSGCGFLGACQNVTCKCQ
jgi:hypothetical protein